MSYLHSTQKVEQGFPFRGNPWLEYSNCGVLTERYLFAYIDGLAYSSCTYYRTWPIILAYFGALLVLRVLISRDNCGGAFNSEPVMQSSQNIAIMPGQQLDLYHRLHQNDI